MIFDALGIAASSLKTQQKAIDVVSHNMANVNTPGYSRQIANMGTINPQQLDSFSFGRGVQLNNISRNIDPIINKAMINNGSQQAYWTNLQSGLRSIENLFGSLQSTGLAAAVDDFFLATQQLANNPQDQAQQFNVRNKSETLTLQLSNMSQQLQSAQQIADTNLDQNLQSANSLLDQIAALNKQISQSEVASAGVAGQANDLRDQRDQAVRDLATLLPIQSVLTNDSSLLLQSLSGDLLVQDGVAQHLSRSTSINAKGFRDIVIQGSQQAITGLDQSGAIGGSISLRDQHLGAYISELDSIAVNLAFGINQIHASGSSSSHASLMTSGIGSNNPSLSINDITQNNPFATQIQNGSFNIHVYDATGVPLTPSSQTTINITTTSSMTSIAADITANVAGVSASLDSGGHLILNGGTNSFGFADDSSNFLAAYQINGLFQGTNAAQLKVSDAVMANVGLISTGKIDLLTSSLQAGDNSVALAMMNLQNTAVSFDGSTTSSLNNRTSSLSAQYGSDTAMAAQQQTFHQAEGTSLSQQREAFSGVNIDEELVSMLKFQRAYEASAKIIQTSNTMMDSLMGLIR